ncbi:unnamed protein product [Cuscuta europaea]|uniref:Uncharacterized protein n=1 Tax=Cuscuta europaea TaxID=41803 RepID=A0A9P0YWF8_CUSEU|nr:unnamed protein product [Cuscuta europaea]
MESDDDFESFSPCEEPSPVLKNPSFKRLKKPGVALKNPHVNSTDDIFLFPEVDFAKLEALEASKSLEDESDDSREPLSSDKSHDNECELESGYTGNRKDSRRALSFYEDNEFDMNPGLKSLGECEQIEGDLEPPAVEFLSKIGDGSEGTMEGMEDHKPKETGSKRSNADFKSNGNDKSKSKKAKHNVEDAAELKPKEPASNKRRERKERKQNLQQIHVETQRILREKKDASFKPIPVVNKPISSVLQKIRQRKLEISKNITLSDTLSAHTINGHMRELTDEDDFDNTYNEDIIVIRSEKKTEEKTDSHVEDLKDDATGPADSEVNENCQSVPSQPFRDIVLDEVPKPMFRAPVDTQDLFGDSQDRDEIIEIPECKEDSNPLEEVMAPSVLAMNLKFDSLPPDECSSDEEDNDTDDVDQDAKLDAPSPRGDPVKAFLDEEAEEEDDSDNDVHRFSENEDDEDFEAVKDIIATNYEEKPSDNERRNELHRKWLEQQDAAGTEDLLQKLKFGSNHSEPTLLEEEQVDSEGEDFNEDAGEHTKSTSRVNKRKAKQIITQMFMEKDDVFLSDDDEEKDKMIVKQRVLIRAEEKTTLVSPIEDEDSKTLFGLIKKHNVVPDKKKKAKPPSFFDKILGGPKDNSFSKSSFLGRTSKNHIPVPHKQSSSLVRSFIFERDDSNSRNSISMSDDSSDMVIKENNPTRSNVPRLSNSQAKFNIQSKSSVAQTSSGASLFEILKQSSSPLSSFGDQEHGINFTQALHAAFKVPKKPAKFGTL